MTIKSITEPHAIAEIAAAGKLLQARNTLVHLLCECGECSFPRMLTYSDAANA